MKKILRSILILLVLILMTFIILWNIRPYPKALNDYALKKKMDTQLPFTIQFLGNTNILFDDGKNAWMTDAFFSRPSASKVLFTKVAPNKKVIQECLERAGIEDLDMIVPVHSHFDHAMDAAMVADLTNAQLWGSTSTLNIGRGYGLEESQMMLPQWDSIYAIGKFKIQFVKSRHWQYPDPEQRKLLLDNAIEKPLVPPASVFDYKEGDSYTILVKYDTLNIAIQGSAGFREGSLPAFDADILFLSIAGLETMDKAYNDAYQQHLIEPLKPKVLVPIHWDDFTISLADGLKTTNVLVKWSYNADLEQAFKEVETRNSDREIKVLELWDRYNVLEIME